MDWEIYQQQLVYDGHFKVTKFDLSHEKYNGENTPILKRELISREDAVAVVAYDPETDELVLVEQFRVGAIREDQPWLIEIVAGLMDQNESPEEVSKREMQEEIGCLPSQLQKIGEFYTSPGGIAEWVHLYIGKISVKEAKSNGGLDHEGEDIKVLVVPASDAEFMLSTGEVRSAIAIIGLQWFVINKENIRKQWSG